MVRFFFLIRIRGGRSTFCVLSQDTIGFNFRYATRRSRNCENDAARETSDDVQRYVAKGFTSGLQKIHARCKIFWCKQQHTHICTPHALMGCQVNTSWLLMDTQVFSLSIEFTSENLREEFCSQQICFRWSYCKTLVNCV